MDYMAAQMDSRIEGAQHPQKQLEEAVRAGWNQCALHIFSLCEQTGDEASAMTEAKKDREPVAAHFMRGRAFEAKQIARAMSSIGPENCEQLAGYLVADAMVKARATS